MEILIISIFVLGYILITLEHTIKIDKLIPALGMMGVLWAIIALNHLEVFDINLELLKLEPTHIEEVLLHHLGKTAEILIFLLGAMTIVEIIDYFNGFSGIKQVIKTRSKVKILWIFGLLAFVLSAIIDNLTATIVLITLLQKLVKVRSLKLWYAGLIIIAANAGGAWSPIGDITTTMLWIGNKVSEVNLVKYLIIPSIVCMVVPFFIASRFSIFKGELEVTKISEESNPHGNKMLFLGLGSILFVPFFKVITHLPPYVGMMLSLAIVTLVGEILSSRRFSLHSLSNDSLDESQSHSPSPIFRALSKIEMPSILFFLGILMTVAALESLGIVFNLGKSVQESIPIHYFVILLGAGSAVIDNVPLVAASMGMFDLAMDEPVWHFIAYSAGTGGSMLIIGSAAGVVAMGMEKISFFWYLKNIAWLAAIGYLTGACSFLLFQNF